MFFLAGALLALLAGAWILQLWASTVGAIDGYDSGASMELWQLRQGAIGTLLFAFSLNPILMLAAAWAITGIVKEPASRPVLTLLVVCALVVPALILLVSLHTPLNQTRNFAGFVGPATLFAAMGFQQIVQRLKLDRVRAAVALAGVLAGSLLIGLNADRFYPTLERDEWRTAGAYVRSLPGCDGAMIPVSAQWERRPEGAAVGIPARVTTSMRMYGYYAGQPERLAPVYGDDNVLPPGAGEGACPIMLWIGHTTPEFADRRAQELAGAAYREMTRVDFAGNAVFVRRDMPTP